MASEEIKLVITADDKASKPVDALTKKVEKLEKSKAEIEITADSKKAEQSIGDLIKQTDKLDGDTATVVLALKGAEIEQKLTDILQDIAKVDGSDATIDVKMTEANQLKGDLDQIEAKVKELNGIPVDIDTKPARKGVDDLGKSADSSKSVLANMVGNSTQDLGALTGIAGSAGVAIGQMGEYIADAVAGGEKFGSVFANFAKVAGPLLALTAITGAISTIMAESAARTKNATEQQDAWTTALESGQNVADNFTAHLREEGKVMSDTTEVFDKHNTSLKDNERGWSGLGGVVDGVKTIFGASKSPIEDVSGLLDKAGLKVSTFARASVDGERGMQRWTEAVNNSNLSVKDKDKLLSAMVQSQGNYGKAVADNEQNERLFALSADEVTSAIAKQAAGIGDLTPQWNSVVDALTAVNNGQQVTAEQTKAVNDLMNRLGISEEEVFTKGNELLQARQQALAAVTEALNGSVAAGERRLAQIEAETTAEEALKTAVDNYNQSLLDAVTAQQSTADANLALGAATDAWAQFLEDAPQKIKDAKGDQQDLNAVYRDGIEQIKGLADAQVKANGQTKDTTAGIDAWNREMLFGAQHATPAVRAQILGYIADANGIPKEKVTEIAAHTDDATFETVAGELATLSKTRESTVTVEADTRPAETAIQELIKARNMKVNVDIVARSGAGFSVDGKKIFDSGGVAGPFGGVAGERGSEILNGRYITTGPTYVPPGTRVVSRKRTAVFLRSHGLKGYDTGRNLPGYDRGTAGAPIPIVPRDVPAINVYLRAQAIGGGFEVTRMVKQGVEKAQRLYGSR